MTTSGYMHKYYDWAAFEIFVKSLHEAEGEVVVDRDVTEVDRYGAKRQTDVKITRRTRFYCFVTLVECKRWKEAVSRDRIDVLAASIEALGASNGAIFTTTGFEEGAIAYAKGKRIELFVVRDLTPQEWGLPGQHISFFVHTIAAEFRDVSTPKAQAISLVEENPGSLALKICLDKEMVRDPDFDLFSVKTGARGPNLIGVLADAHGLLLGALSNSVDVIDNGKDLTLEFLAACEVDLTGSDYRQLRLPTVAVRLNHIQFSLLAHITQSTINFDRGASLDFAVMVESYVSDRRLIAHRRTNDPGINFQVANPQDANIRGSNDVLRNGSLMKIICAPWVRLGDVVAAKQAVAGQLIRVLVDVVDGKPRLALRVEPLPAQA